MTTILDAAADPNLFAPWFRDRATWTAWLAWLAALFALPMTAEQLAIYREHTGRTVPLQSPATEGWLVCGRRAGKSFMLALIAVFLATFRDHRPYLQKGERATVLVIAADRKQARVILRYIRGLLTGVPMLARMIERETAEAFDLANSVTIEVGTASFRTVRGYSFCALLCDELAFWRSEDSASPDDEILNAVRPGMSTIPGAMLLCASSPYSKSGALWSAYKRHYGQEGDPVLVWRAPTRAMNPTVPQSVIDEAMDRDASAAAAEYLAEFRNDIENFITTEALEAVTDNERERPYEMKHEYVAFTDPSGGSADSFTLAIGHKEGKTCVLDLLREQKPPFSPEVTVEAFCDVMKGYRVTKVHGDRYAGEWPREQFNKHGINFEISERPKSDLYRDVLPLINSKNVLLLRNERMARQFVGLERRTSRAGKDSIDHGPAGHDDLCNAAAGSLVLANQGLVGCGGPLWRSKDLPYRRDGSVA